MENLQPMLERLSPKLIQLGIALGVLIAFWIGAVIASAVVRGLLKRTSIDEKIVSFMGLDADKIDTAGWGAKLVYWVILIFGLIGFLSRLGLHSVSAPITNMLNRVFGFLPQIAAAAGLALAAFVVAWIVRKVVTTALSAVSIDERLGAAAGEAPDRQSIASSIGNALYWLVFLLFLPMILDALDLQGLLEPIQTMLNRLLGFLPNLLAAGMILLVGWFAARIVRQVVRNLLQAAGIDRVGQQAGVDGVVGRGGLSGLIGTLVYVLILIPVAIAALDALQLGAISQPAGNMLSTILESIPLVFTAALIVGIAYMVGRFASQLVADLLGRTGFDSLPVKLGLGWRPAEGAKTPSQMVGSLVLVVALFFAAIEAARQLQLDALATILMQFIDFAGHVLLGIVIFGVGLYLANLAAGLIESSARAERKIFATAARVAILALTSAMALREMGLAEEIINMAFGILLAAVGLAIALAFGLGSRDAAGRAIDGWQQYMRDRRGGGSA